MNRPFQSQNQTQTQTIFLVLLVFLVAFNISFSSPPYSCKSGEERSYKFCNRSLPIEVRSSDLVSRLTLDEKISQLVNTADFISRLDIPAYQWWSESLHGVSDSGPGIIFNTTIPAATSFPQVILTAATFDSDLWFRIAQAIGTEARAVYNAGQAQGMTFWAPNINIFRDPRWGRGQETPGEDPNVAGKYSISYVRGIQGDTFQGGKLKQNLKVSACCKHFTAYDLDNWNGTTRYAFDAQVTAQDLADTFQPPFKSCVEQGRASGIMCSYNRINGVPNCADYNLLSETARKLWGFDGYITSDCDAVSIIHDVQGYAKTPEDAVADVLKAGMDVNCGSYLKNYTKSAVQAKKLPVSQIDRALHNLFSVRMRLGLFDGDPKNLPFGKIGPAQVCTQEHHNLALEAARNGIVLLKNEKKLLPLSRTNGLVVIGPNAKNVQTLLGNYAGPPCRNVTPLKAMYMYANFTRYISGCNNVQCMNASIGKAIELARNADRVVLVMGLDQTQEKEDHDRVDLRLPGKQQSLITQAARASKKPVVLVLICGGPVDVTFAKNDPNIGGILWAGYPGEAGGIAIAEVIFGDHNPGGKLPVTWYPQEFIKIPMTDMRMRSDLAKGYPGRTYRFYKGTEVYKFGYGLSYSNYSYKFATQDTLSLSPSFTLPKIHQNSDSARYRQVQDMGSNACDKVKLTVCVEVENHGDMAGKHAVLLFVGQKNLNDKNPIKQLAAFESVSLNVREKAQVKFVLSPCEHLSRANEDGVMVLEEGLYFLSVGDVEHPISIVLDAN